MARLIWLAFGAFTVGTEGLVIAGILPQIAGGFGLSIAMAGHLVTVFALTYAVGSPLMAVATGAVERKRLLVIALALFALANFCAAAAPNYLALIGARVLLALSACTYMPAASAYAALSVEPQRRGRALALIYSGMTVATVLGVPFGTFLGQTLGWQSTFIAVGIMALIAVAGIVLALPNLAAPPIVSLAERIAVARRGDVLSVLALTTLSLAGAFSMLTYLAPYLQQAIGFAPATLPAILVAFGVAGAAGNMIAGFVADHWDLRRYAMVMLAALAASLLSLALIAAFCDGTLAKGLTIIAIMAWGLAGWGIPATQQMRLVRLEPSHASVLISLNASALYLGTALGAALGSLSIALAPLDRLSLTGGAIEILALAWLIASSRRLTSPLEGEVNLAPQA